MKKENWLLEQFKAARKEVASWSRIKQRMMRNAVRDRSKNLG